MTERLRVNSPGDLVAAVPHVLGFHPENSLVLVLAGEGAPMARVDLPPTADEAPKIAEALAPAMRRFATPDRATFLVAFGNGRAEVAGETLNVVADSFRAAGHRVDGSVLVQGEEWLDTHTGRSGIVSDTTKSMFAAQTVFAGLVQPLSSREALEPAFHGDPAPVSALLPAAQTRFAALDREGLVAEAGWVGASIDDFRHERQYASDADAARILCAINSPRVFNSIAMASTREDARDLGDFWTNLSARAPEPVRSSALELAALNSYLTGNGAKTDIALSLVRRPSEMSRTLEACMLNAVSPRDWERSRSRALSAMQLAALRGQPPSPNPSGPPPSTPPPGPSGPTL